MTMETYRKINKLDKLVMPFSNKAAQEVLEASIYVFVFGFTPLTILGITYATYLVFINKLTEE